mmetsp:Transcript_6607/g.17281  ORF Transcript_6607/g.17281 Transcript_6607/m.17281 type:complete len:386 (-) Transcript_6607:859-2016(-)
MSADPVGRSTLVVYMHFSSPARQRNKRTSDNLAFFVRHGLVQQPDTIFSLLFGGSDFSIDLPARDNVLVHSVRGVRGYEFSHFRAFLEDPSRFPGCSTSRSLPLQCGSVDSDVRTLQIASFRSFILLTDTLRGPFVPPFLPEHRWPSLLTSMLSSRVKLVGASINCLNCGTDIGDCDDRLHTEGALTVTDSVGLRVLLKQWQALPRGNRDKWREIWQGEVFGPVAIRQAGFNIAALSFFWRGHNFLDLQATQRKCALVLNKSINAVPEADLAINPLGQFDARTRRYVTDELHGAYQRSGGVACKGCWWGTDLSPFETMFTHHYTSPMFAHGDVHIYSEMDEGRRQIDGPSADSINGRATTVDFFNGSVFVRAFGARRRPPTAQQR